MVPKKKTSKRFGTKLRSKVDKKVKEHHRKVKKESKANPKKKSRKDPGIPNSLPFKEKLLLDLLSNKQKEMSRNPTTLEIDEQEKLSELAKKASEQSESFCEASNDNVSSQDSSSTKIKG